MKKKDNAIARLMLIGAACIAATAFLVCTSLTGDNGILSRDDSKPDSLPVVIVPSFLQDSVLISHIVGETSYGDTARLDLKDTAKDMQLITGAPWIGYERTASTVLVYFLDSVQSISLDTTLTTWFFVRSGGKTADSAKVTARVVASLVKPDSCMKLVPAALYPFTMGSEAPVDEASPVHVVTFTHNYWMDSAEVTLRQYLELMHKNPSSNSTHLSYPIYNVTWYDAVLYCNERSKKSQHDTVYSYSSVIGTAGAGCTRLMDLVINYSSVGFRLPTEAEWEFACRANTSTAYYWGDDINSDYCWYQKQTLNDVGRLKPNAFGLYDMSGNVTEWCNDKFTVYTADPVTDPVFPVVSQPNVEAVIRGGSWSDDSSLARSAFRDSYAAQSSVISLGFRCVIRAGK
jgi:formylglycine-generating enzyme required for sulfatase activity